MKLRSCIVVLLLLTCGVSCNRDPEVVKKKYLESGNKYFERGRIKEASIMYRNALKKDRRYGEAYYRLGLAQIKLREWMAASRSLRRAVELQPENMDATAELAGIYLTAYLSDSARPEQLREDIDELADNLLEKDADSFDGLRLKGYMAITGGDVKDAVAKFRRANEIKPMDPELVHSLVQALAVDNQFPEGEKLARALIGKNPDYGPIYDVLYAQYLRQKQFDVAESVLKLKVDNNPKQSQFRTQLALHYYGLQRHDEVTSTLEYLISHPEDFPDGQQQVGDFYFRLRQYDQAIRHYKAGIESNPDQKPVLQKRLVETLNSAGRKTEAAQLVEGILEENPEDADARAMRAAILLETGNREELQSAIDELQSAVTRTPTNPVLHFNLGRAHWSKGELDLARAQFQEALKLRGDYLAPRLGLAQINLAKGEFAAAMQTVGPILSMAPTNVPARLLRANALAGLGDSAQAKTELQRILQAQPNSAEALLNLGLLNLRQKQYREAEEAFERCRQVNPNDLRSLLGMAETYIAQNQYDRAIEFLKTASETASGSSTLRQAIANTAVRAERYDLAVSEYKNLLAENPKAADIHLRLGETYRRMGNMEAAVESFSKCKELDPNNPTAYVPLALLLHRLGRSEEAKSLYQQVLKLQPDNSVALNNLAYMMAESGGSLDEALTLAQRAKQKAPHSPDVADTLGWIYIKRNLSDNAISIYRDLLETNPNNPTFRYHMAMALIQKGERTQAVKELQTALQNKPSKEEAARIRELIAKIG